MIYRSAEPTSYIVQSRPFPRGSFICLLLYSGDVLSAAVVRAQHTPLGVSALSRHPVT